MLFALRWQGETMIDLEKELVAQKTPAEWRSKIVQLEACMKEMTGDQIQIKTTHYFAPGIYMREVFLPKGCVATGHIHKMEHMSVLSQGELTVYTEGGMKRLKASTVVKAQPGMKRCVFAHEDSVWITVHANPDNETDIKKLEDRYVTDDFAKLPEETRKQIEGGKS
jgi:quercetin dioxygenase-like cupin family protein